MEHLYRIPYALIVDSFMFAKLCIRLDICYEGLKHWMTVKQILKYFWRTRTYYSSLDLVPLSYANLTSKLIKIIAIYIRIIFYGNFTRRSIKWLYSATFTMKVEYVASCEVAKEVMWIKKFLTNVVVVLGSAKPLSLYCDNNMTVTNAKKPKSHQRVKILNKNIIF